MSPCNKFRFSVTDSDSGTCCGHSCDCLCGGVIPDSAGVKSVPCCIKAVTTGIPDNDGTYYLKRDYRLESQVLHDNYPLLRSICIWTSADGREKFTIGQWQFDWPNPQMYYNGRYEGTDGIYNTNGENYHNYLHEPFVDCEALEFGFTMTNIYDTWPDSKVMIQKTEIGDCPDLQPVCFRCIEGTTPANWVINIEGFTPVAQGCAEVDINGTHWACKTGNIRVCPHSPGVNCTCYGECWYGDDIATCIDVTSLGNCNCDGHIQVSFYGGELIVQCVTVIGTYRWVYSFPGDDLVDCRSIKDAVLTETSSSGATCTISADDSKCTKTHNIWGVHGYCCDDNWLVPGGSPYAFQKVHPDTWCPNLAIDSEHMPAAVEITLGEDSFTLTPMRVTTSSSQDPNDPEDCFGRLSYVYSDMSTSHCDDDAVFWWQNGQQIYEGEGLFLGVEQLETGNIFCWGGWRCNSELDGSGYCRYNTLLYGSLPGQLCSLEP